MHMCNRWVYVTEMNETIEIKVDIPSWNNNLAGVTRMALDQQNTQLLTTKFYVWHLKLRQQLASVDLILCDHCMFYSWRIYCCSINKLHIFEFVKLHFLWGLCWSASGILRLQGLWINIPKDQLFCLLGPNGAGKSTTINCVIGITPVTGGDGESRCQLYILYSSLKNRDVPKLCMTFTDSISFWTFHPKLYRDVKHSQCYRSLSSGFSFWNLTHFLFRYSWKFYCHSWLFVRPLVRAIFGFTYLLFFT